MKGWYIEDLDGNIPQGDLLFTTQEQVLAYLRFLAKCDIVSRKTVTHYKMENNTTYIVVEVETNEALVGDI